MRLHRGCTAFDAIRMPIALSFGLPAVYPVVEGSKAGRRMKFWKAMATVGHQGPPRPLCQEPLLRRFRA